MTLPWVPSVSFPIVTSGGLPSLPRCEPREILSVYCFDLKVKPMIFTAQMTLRHFLFSLARVVLFAPVNGNCELHPASYKIPARAALSSYYLRAGWDSDRSEINLPPAFVYLRQCSKIRMPVFRSLRPATVTCKFPVLEKKTQPVQTDYQSS